MSLEERLARARADRRELAWVTRRLAEARDDRDRVTAQLAIAEQSRAYEQADVDRRTRGVGAVLRGLLAGNMELTTEQQELAAAQLLCDELAAEVAAIDVYLAELMARARSVADAEARYAAALAEAEEAARTDGALDEELDTLAVTEADLAWRRVEIAEVIATGLEVQQTFISIVDLVRKLSRDSDREEVVIEGLFDAITGRTTTLYSELTAALAYATQGLHRFARACTDLSTPANDLEPWFAPLRGADGFVLRDIVWTNDDSLEPILAEVSRVSSALASAVGELRARDAGLVRAITECARMRAELLDPAAR